MGSLEYNIAGPADDEDYAQAEYLAEMLMVSLPTITCNLVPVMPDDWGAFAKQKCAFLGCRERAPLIWLNSGAVVGGLKEFSKECAEKYGVEIKGVDVRSHRDTKTRTQHTLLLSPALIIILSHSPRRGIFGCSSSSDARAFFPLVWRSTRRGPR